MKRNILFVAAAMMALMATSCNKEEENTLGELKQMPITITAGYEGNNTKVTYTESGNTISATWDEGDQILVVYDGYVSTLTLSTGAGTGTATFTGTISYRTTPSANSILYCFVKDVNNAAAVTVVDDRIIYSDAAFQSQDGTLASAAKCNTYSGSTTYGNGSNIRCLFSVNTSILKLAISAPDELHATDNATLTYKSGDIELAKASFEVGTRGMKTIYMAIPSGSYTGNQTIVYKGVCNHGTPVTTITVDRTISDHANFAVGQTYSRAIYFGHYIDLSYLTYDYTAGDRDTLVNTLGSNVKISIAADAAVVLRDVNINKDGTWTTGDYAGITCLGNATIILDGTTTMFIKGFHANYPGIHIPQGYTLTIGSTNLSTAGLDASSNGSAAGIGGGNNIACGTIVINNTRIWAHGGTGAAGIGSGAGASSSCGKIVINGGNVVAEGSGNAAGIGTGDDGKCDTIIINGGYVSSTGSGTGAGIGTGGNGGDGEAIIIGNGITEVKAVKQHSSAKCVGLGANGGECGFLYIDGNQYPTSNPTGNIGNYLTATLSVDGNTWTLTRRTN